MGFFLPLSFLSLSLLSLFLSFISIPIFFFLLLCVDRGYKYTGKIKGHLQNWDINSWADPLPHHGFVVVLNHQFSKYLSNTTHHILGSMLYSEAHSPVWRQTCKQVISKIWCAVREISLKGIINSSYVLGESDMWEVTFQLCLKDE